MTDAVTLLSDLSQRLNGGRRFWQPMSVVLCRIWAMNPEHCRRLLIKETEK